MFLPHTLRARRLVKAGLVVLVVLGEVAGSLQYHFPPSILTFNEEYVGKHLRVGVAGPSEDKRDGDDADYVLPLCCDIHEGDVISFQCPNSLSTSPKDAVFNRRTWIAPQHLVSSKTSTKFNVDVLQKMNSLLCNKNCNISTFWEIDKATILIPATSPDLLDLSERFISSAFRCTGSKIIKARLSLNSTQFQKGTYFLLDGYFKFQNEYYRPDEFCVSGISRDAVEVEVCPVDCANPNTPCIHKCCGKDQIYSFGYGEHPRGCVDVEEGATRWYPTLYHSLRRPLTPHEALQLNPHILHKFPTSFKANCRFNKTTVFPHGKGIAGFLTSLTHKNFRNLQFRVRKDGWLLYSRTNDSSPPAEVAKHIDNYCIDGAQDYGESSEFANLEAETVLFLCSGGVDEESETLPTTPTPSSPSSGSSPSAVDQDAAGALLLPHLHSPSLSIIAEPPAKHSVEVSNSVEEDFVDNSRLPTQTTPAGDSALFPSIAALRPRPVSILALSHTPIGQVKRKTKPALSQTTFNHNAHQLTSQEQVEQIKASLGVAGPIKTLEGPFKKYSDMKQQNKKPPVNSIPTCCAIAPDVNDGFTHHCRNRRMDMPQDSPPEGPRASSTWNVPKHFTTRDTPLTFKLSSHPTNCGSGKFQFQGFIHNFEQTRGTHPGERRHGILDNGFLKYDNEFYSPDEYCVNGLSPRIVEVLICKPDCAMPGTPCIQKCCGLDEIYNLGLSTGIRGCQPLTPTEVQFVPTLFHQMNVPLTPAEMTSLSPHFVQKYPPAFQHTCHNKITLAFPFSKKVAGKLTPADSSERGGVSFKHLRFHFRADGKLMYTYPEPDGTTIDSIYDRGEFCVDGVRDFGETEPFGNHENQTILFICASAPHSSAEK